MARIKYSALVTSINGTSGGTTFQRNLYGNTMKNKPTMTIPRTPYQNKQKEYLALCAGAWRNLTNTERQSWINYATTYPFATRLNPDAYLNGFNYFVKYNTLRLMTGMAILLTVSLTQQTLGVNDIEIDTDGGNFLFACSTSGAVGTWRCMIFLSARIQGYSSPRTNKTRYITQFQMVAGAGSVELAVPYANRMGVGMVAGASYYIDVTWFNVASGQIFEWPTSVIAST